MSLISSGPALEKNCPEQIGLKCNGNHSCMLVSCAQVLASGHEEHMRLTLSEPDLYLALFFLFTLTFGDDCYPVIHPSAVRKSTYLRIIPNVEKLAIKKVLHTCLKRSGYQDGGEENACVCVRVFRSVMCGMRLEAEILFPSGAVFVRLQGVELRRHADRGPCHRNLSCSPLVNLRT